MAISCAFLDAMNAHRHQDQHISYMYYTICSSTDLTLTFEWVLTKLVYHAYLVGMQESHWAHQLYEITPRQSVPS